MSICVYVYDFYTTARYHLCIVQNLIHLVRSRVEIGPFMEATGRGFWDNYNVLLFSCHFLDR